jgi:hypothetical protein
MAKPKVQFHETPNPNAGKFTVGRTLVDGRSGRTFASAQDAAANPIAAALLADEGVASVFIVADFVTVTKHPSASWKEMTPRISKVLRKVVDVG